MTIRYDSHAAVLGLLVAAILVCANAGCASGSGPESEPQAKVEPEAKAALGACPEGVWLQADFFCQCPIESFASPECGKPDCIQNNVLALAHDGRSLDFVMRRSGQEFSVAGDIGGFSKGTWTASEHELTQTVGSNQPFVTEFTCDAETLVRTGKVSYTRAAPKLEQVVLKASEAAPYPGMWTQVTY